jgi:hypothetical protein
MEPYSEADFVAYALAQMKIEVLKRERNIFHLAHGFELEVERTNLYKLSHEGWVISPFNDIGAVCSFIIKNVQ